MGVFAGSAILALTGTGAMHAQDAESVVYGAAKSCAGLRAYLRSYPEGRFRDDASARIASECEAPKPARAQPMVQPAKPADPCIQARADWNEIRTSSTTSVLRAFIEATPSACAVQRAQAEARIAEVEDARRTAAATQANAAANQKRAQWNGVPEFDGRWVKASGSGCGAFPWSFQPAGKGLTLNYAGGTSDYEVVSTTPPKIRKENGFAVTVDGDGLRAEKADGSFACSIRRETSADVQARNAASAKSQATDKKRQDWSGVPEFEGTWVFDSGSESLCPSMPRTFSLNGSTIRRTNSDGNTIDYEVERTNPPTLKDSNGNRMIFENGRIKSEKPDGGLFCYMKRG